MGRHPDRAAAAGAIGTFCVTFGRALAGWLAVGFRTGIPVIPAARAFEAGHPDVVVDVQRMEWDDQSSMLLDGRVDVGYVRLPIDETGLRVIPLYTEPLMVVLPAGHRLAGKEEVIEGDLAGEPLVWHADLSTQPTRRPLPDSGLRVRGVEEKLEHVAAGRGISFVGRSETVFYSRPDISAAQATADITAECGNHEACSANGAEVSR